MRSYRLFTFSFSIGSVVLASLFGAACAEPVSLSGDGSQAEGGSGGSGGSGEAAGSSGSGQSGASGSSSGSGGASGKAGAPGQGGSAGQGAGGSGQSGSSQGGASGQAGSSQGGSSGQGGSGGGGSGGGSGEGGASGAAGGGAGGVSGGNGGASGAGGQVFGGSGGTGGSGGSGGTAGSAGQAGQGGSAGASAGGGGSAGAAGAAGGGPVGRGMLINEIYVDRTVSGDFTEWVEVLGQPSQPLFGIWLRHYELGSDGAWKLKFDLPIASAGDATAANGTWTVGGTQSPAKHSVLISKPDNWGMSDRGTLQLYVGATNELLDVVAWGDMSGPDAPMVPLKTVQGSPVPFGAYVDGISLARKPGANSGDNAADFCVQAVTANQPNGATCQ